MAHHGASFVLVHRQQKDAADNRSVRCLRFVRLGLPQRRSAAEELGYIPMPTAVVDQVEKTWEKDLKDSGGQKLWPGQ